MSHPADVKSLPCLTSLTRLMGLTSLESVSLSGDVYLYLKGYMHDISQCWLYTLSEKNVE